MQGHKDLEVSQKSMDLVVAIYKLTSSFPKIEIYGLASQMQRAAVSIPSSIAEGHGLKQKQAFLRHPGIANGSRTELESQLEIANRVGYMDVGSGPLIEKAHEIGRMLAGLRKSLQSRLQESESWILNPFPCSSAPHSNKA